VAADERERERERERVRGEERNGGEGRLSRARQERV
jgi:hypothetical protein